MLSPYERSSSIVALAMPEEALEGWSFEAPLREIFWHQEEWPRPPLAKNRSLQPTKAITQAMKALKAEAAQFIAEATSYHPRRHSTCP